MSTKVFQKLLAKAVTAMHEEGTIENVKVFFKSRKRKKFISNANKDITVFYRDINIENTTADLQEDNAVLDSKVFTLSPSEKIANAYGTAMPDATAAKAAADLHIWEIYKELRCQAELLNAFPSDVFVNTDEFSKFNVLLPKVENQLAKTKARLTAKSLYNVYVEKFNEVEDQVDDYKALLAVLK